jgi:tetratricopeptide (TPR) repeat protein
MNVEQRVRLVGRLAVIFLLSGFLFSITEARQVFRNPAMEPNDEAQKAYIRGRELAERGRFEEAAAEFQNAAKLRGGNCVECFQMLAQVELQSGKYREAAAAYRQAIELKPSNEAELHNALGVAFFLQKDKEGYESAVTEFRQAIDMSKGRVVKAYYTLGHALIKAGRPGEAKEAFRQYLEREPNASEAAEVRALIADPGKAGEPFAPVFSVKTTNGDEVSLEKLKGKVVLLDFWASWCKPCRADMPEIRKIWKKYGGDQFVIIGINLDRNRRDFDQYVKEEAVVWPQYFDGHIWDNKISLLYHVNAIPHSVLIDREGVIREIGLRGGRLSNAIGELLKK